MGIMTPKNFQGMPLEPMKFRGLCILALPDITDWYHENLCVTINGTHIFKVLTHPLLQKLHFWFLPWDFHPSMYDHSSNAYKGMYLLVSMGESARLAPSSSFYVVNSAILGCKRFEIGGNFWIMLLKSYKIWI